MIKKAGMGVLGGMVVGGLANKFAPQYSGIASLVGAYMTGGLEGAVVTGVLQGGLGISSSSGTVTI